MAPTSYPEYTSAIMQALYMIDDLRHLMESVAASLSSHIRSVSSEAVPGKVWAMETYVHVRWIWLMLPMALAPASLLFLLTAIWTSKNGGVGIWKSSGMAVIFHGLEKPLYANDLHRQSTMEKTWKEIVVRLQRTGDDTQKLVAKAIQASTSAPDLALRPTGQEGKPFVRASGDSSQHPGSDPGPLSIPRGPAGTKQFLATTIEANTH